VSKKDQAVHPQQPVVQSAMDEDGRKTLPVQSAARTFTAYSIQVLMPERGWQQVGRLYHAKETAHSWVPFVKAYWHHWRTRVKAVKVKVKAASSTTDDDHAAD
jgi:hypothetical protein